jgi:hypothetical protein
VSATPATGTAGRPTDPDAAQPDAAQPDATSADVTSADVTSADAAPADAAPADASDGSDRPRRPLLAPRSAGRWWTLLVAVLGLLGGVAAFWPHRGRWVGYNGDHYYYASMALQYAGYGYDRSLAVVGDYFHYPYSWAQLDMGYLNPAFAPLIYPRVVLGLAAWPFVRAWGVQGVWAAGALFGTGSVLAMLLLARRRIGLVGLLVLPILLGATRYGPEFMFGIFLEAPVILATAVMMLALPLGSARRTWWHAVAAAGMVPVMFLSRQVPVLPIGMVLGGWLWAWIGSRRFRNAWFPFAVTVTPATVISYLMIARWAPYNVLPFLLAITKSKDGHELLQKAPAMWRESWRVDSHLLVQYDLPMFFVVLLALAGLLLAIRNPITGVVLGALASGVVTELANGQANSFRYVSPAIPPLFLIATLAPAWLVHRFPRLTGRPPGDWPGAALTRPEPRPSAPLDSPPQARTSSRIRPGVLAAAGSWLTVAALVAGAIAVHRPAPLDGARRTTISAATFGHPWPFTVPSGTLICAGRDYQMWFQTPDGVRYALSGSAMAATLGPTVLDLAPKGTTYAWPEIRPVLNVGMHLCGSTRDFQKE